MFLLRATTSVETYRLLFVNADAAALNFVEIAEPGAAATGRLAPLVRVGDVAANALRDVLDGDALAIEVLSNGTMSDQELNDWIARLSA